MTAHPDVAAICGACGPPITGVLQALKSVAQLPAKLGSLGISTAVDAAEGKTVSANVDSGTAVVTKANAAQFGWFGW